MEILDIPQFQNNHLHDISHVSDAALRHNGRMKVFPDGYAELLCADRDIFREKGFERAGYDTTIAADDVENDVENSSEDAIANLERSKRRARVMVADYIRASSLDVFCTFTLDSEKVDRYDPLASFHKLHNWLDNCVRRKGLRYVLVPEYHKDGAIHYHACINSGALSLVDSGTIDRHTGGKPRKPRSKAERAAWLQEGGSIVYNVADWHLGFSTAILMYGDRGRAISYVCKYINKSADKIGGRWYYSGGNLHLPTTYTCDCNYGKIADSVLAGHRGGSWPVESLGCNCTKVILEGGEIHEYFKRMDERN